MEEISKKAIYNDKVKLILKGLTEGKSREELAEELGYKNYKSLDMYMRRKHWRWNSKTEKYKEEVPKTTFNDNLNKIKTIGTKAGRVIDLFDSGIEEPITIAKKAGFRDHIEMAKHMRNQNYIWDEKSNNYVMRAGKLENETLTKQSLDITYETDINQFIPLLKMLQSNKDKLIENLMPELQTHKIPTYLVPGIPTILSAQMMSSLKFLLKEYSNEKNITQRQILEVALIEFFNKYGYKYKVNKMLNA
ncbi:hypothetical protein [Clostridium kluyveri]|uniref:Uncharacterized protein n=2 Tax=Clostridium kluyveri TaxID=1534 RepID=A5N1V9_CLOK5|nr:hypothetical protein [Clostridium kluyveri]EDK35105.1 Hypothetical protein CKL_3097 [Clostridium kluyveri DSM 555]BAH07792.1 hypothetical protein CKR_2741 [Clostridium kluyveri NBRC 12016]